MLGLAGPGAEFVAAIDFGTLGYAIVALFLGVWAAAAAVWRLGRFEARYAHRHPLHSHPHVHAEGVAHAHRHFH